MERYKKLRFSEKAVSGILDLMKFDKKNSHGNINFVLLKHIGEPVIDCLVPRELYADAFAYYAE
jgi:3-dehydroquinate synthase